MKKIGRISLFILFLFFFSCDYFEELNWDLPKLPEVIIYNPGYNQIQRTSVVIEGEVTNNGGAEITEKGICYSTLPNATSIEELKINSEKGTDVIYVQINQLIPNTRYYCRAFATNKAGTSYSEEIYFKTKK